MKKFISAITSLCMVASMTSAVVPASINAADATKGFIMKTFDQADSKYATGESKVTVSATDIAAGEVTIPCAMYLDEATPDSQAANVCITVKDTSDAAGDIVLKSYNPLTDAYFSSNKSYKTADGTSFSTNRAVSFASSVDDFGDYMAHGSWQVMTEPEQIPYGTENYYVGCAWTNGGKDYKWTGAKSTDYPMFAFDVILPKGLEAGTYTIEYCNVDSDPSDRVNPVCIIETDSRYANYGDLSNLKLTELEIVVEGSGNTTTTSSTTTTTTTSSKTTTSTSTTQPVGDENLIIDFGSYTANAGDKVVVKPTIKNNGGSFPIAGIDVDFSIDDPLTITAIGGSSAAFGGASVTSNLDQYKASITPLDGSGDPTAAADGEALFQLMVQIPANCPDGTYEIGFGSKVDIFKEGKSSDEWTYQEIKGIITVGNGGTTPGSSSTTTTTTTSTPVGDANLIIDFGSYTAEAGDKVVVKPTIKNNGGTFPIAGIDVEFAIDDPLAITAIGGASAAFGGASVTSNLDQYKASITPLDGSGDPTAAADGEALFQLMVQIPANCPDGTYEIGFGSKVDIFKEGKSSDEWTYQEIKGIITVGNGGTTPGSSSTTTTTTTSTPVGDANLIIDFGSYTAEAGDKVVVKPTIKNNGGTFPIAGIDVEFAIDDPLAITAIGGASAAFGGASVTSNLDQYKASITPLDGSGDPTAAADGEALFQLMVQIPANCPAGTYEIGFGDKVDIFKEGKSSDEWSYQEIVGTITVGGTTTTTTTTTTTSTTTTSTTTQPPVLTPVYGDSNCDGVVNVADVVVLNKWLNNNADYNLTEQGKLNADCYDPKDGKELTAADSDAIIKSIVSLVTLPVSKG